MKRLLHLFLLMSALQYSSFLYAGPLGNITSQNGGGSWHDPSTWDLGRVPTLTDNVIINGGDSVYFTANIVDTVASLTINGGGVLTTYGGNTDTLCVSGNVIIDGKLYVASSFVANITDGTSITINNGGFIYQGLDVGFAGIPSIRCQSIANSGTYSVDPLCNGSLTVGKIGQANSISGNSYGAADSTVYLEVLYDVSINLNANQNIYVYGLLMKNGQLTNANKIVLGLPNAAGFIALGGGDPNAAVPFLDDYPIYNNNNNLIDVRYEYTGGDFTVGKEIPPSNTVNNLAIFGGNVNNSTKIIISSGSISVNQDIDLTNAINRKIVIQGLNHIHCEGDIIDASKTTCYIVTNGGKLKRKVNPPLQPLVAFPVGTVNSFDPIFLNFTTNSEIDTFEVNVHGPLFTNEPSDTSKLVKREWDIHQNTDGGDDANIEFLYDPTVEKGEHFDINGSLVIGHYTNQFWNESGATLSGDTVISNTVFHTFSPFAFGNAHSLPIKLLSFHANRQQNGNVLLNWSVTNEANNKEFNIERSVDGINFEQVGIVVAKGNSIILNNYTFTDIQPLGNLLYYRLKQIDINGKYSYSPVVVVKFVSKNVFSIYSNPVKSKLVLKQSIIKDETVQISIINSEGKIKYNNKLNMNGGFGNVDISKLPSGKYYIQINSASDKCTTVFIKL